MITTSQVALPEIDEARILDLTAESDLWAALSLFLGMEYPTHPYPTRSDIGMRALDGRTGTAPGFRGNGLTADESPWVLKPSPEWRGIRISGESSTQHDELVASFAAEMEIDTTTWRLRDDTFPSNLSMFSPANFQQDGGIGASLRLKAEPTRVRDYTTAAIASRDSYLYGTFRAVLRPSDVPGLITGFFLHRNGPRQEIDIEFPGRDTTKMLVNVYYNPGPIGTKLEYGYRGTPTSIDLGFDAARDFHTYEIEWRENQIVWRVDGVDVHTRNVWQPTPIPDKPLELNLNLWHSRSIDLAGHLDSARLPAHSYVKSIEVISDRSSPTT